MIGFSFSFALLASHDFMMEMICFNEIRTGDLFMRGMTKIKTKPESQCLVSYLIAIITARKVTI